MVNQALMRIKLIDAGKRFNREWIFRNMNISLSAENSYAIVGSNGSGKSTLLQILAGNIQQSEGHLEYTNQTIRVNNEEVFRYISFIAPYLDLVEELTLIEFLEFHKSFKSLDEGKSNIEIASIVGLDNAINKQIRYFSSGMKQRLKLAQAVFSKTPILLMDEPCSYLDQKGVELYYQLIKNYCKSKLIVISSNDQKEYEFCNEIIEINDYK